MRLTDISENTTVNELSPMGLLKKVATKAKTFVPGETGEVAKGALETGKIANDLRSQFNVFRGKVGGGLDVATVTAFLQQQGISADIVDQVLGTNTSATSEPPAQTQTPAADKTDYEIPTWQRKGMKQSDFDKKPTPADTKGSAYSSNAYKINYPKGAVGGVPKVGGDPLAGVKMQTKIDKGAEIWKQSGEVGLKRAGYTPAEIAQVKSAKKNQQFSSKIFQGRAIVEATEESLRWEFLSEQALSQQQVNQIFTLAAQQMAGGGATAPKSGSGALGKVAGAAGSIVKGTGSLIGKFAKNAAIAANVDNAHEWGKDKPDTGVKGATSTGDDDQQIGNLNYSQLQKLLPAVNINELKRAVNAHNSGGQLTASQNQIVSNAFLELMKSDQTTTRKVMDLLRRVQSR